MIVHPTHKTRMSDSLLYDEVCTVCGATDGAHGSLDSPCRGTEEQASTVPNTGQKQLNG